MTRRDATLRALVGYNLKRANSAVTGGVERVLARHGLRRTTYSALSVVADNPMLSQADLAETLAIEPPNMTQIIDELLRAGLIERSRAKTDRRAYALSCTAEGVRLLAEASGDLTAHDRALVDGLSPDECAALIAALQGIEVAGARLIRIKEGADAIPAP